MTRMSRRLWSTDSLPLHIYEQLRAELLIDPFEEVRLMGRHHDDDQNGVADQADPEVLDEHDHNECACEPGHIGDPTTYDGDGDGPETQP